VLAARRVHALRSVERRTGSRAITLIHRRESWSFLGIPFGGFIDIDDSEAVIRAVEMTGKQVPIDQVREFVTALLRRQMPPERAGELAGTLSDDIGPMTSPSTRSWPSRLGSRCPPSCPTRYASSCACTRSPAAGVRQWSTFPFPTYGKDVARVIDVLNEVLATELVCVLRYKRHYYTAQGGHGPAVAAEFLEHAKDEQRHADLAAERISQLGGEPDFNPAVLAQRSHTEYAPGLNLIDMVREDLVAERIAIATYAEIARWLGDADPTTRRLIEQLLAEEEDHAEDLRSLLSRIDANE